MENARHQILCILVPCLICCLVFNFKGMAEIPVRDSIVVSWLCLCAPAELCWFETPCKAQMLSTHMLEKMNEEIQTKVFGELGTVPPQQA